MKICMIVILAIHLLSWWPRKWEKRNVMSRPWWMYYLKKVMVDVKKSSILTACCKD
jgi:hypothetical protein